MDLTSKLKTFWKTDYAFKRLALKTLFLLGLGRFAVLMVPFKKIAGWMGEVNHETEVKPINLENSRLNQLGKVIRAVSPYTPWRSNCFAQALCAHWLLKAKSVEHTIYFGVKFGENKKFEAHAWLRAGDKMITGGAIRKEYTVVGSFACFSGERNNQSVTS